jgi:hypothetical protein
MKMQLSSQPQLVIGGAIGIGCLLRLIWPEDMTWQADEIWMFEHARAIVLGQAPFPPIGMLNSAGFANPGMSLWAFVPLAGSADPIAMVRWVMMLNIGAIGAFLGFIRWGLPPAQQLTWLWGMAIASVNPMAILFSRKIWAQNILPPFGFLIFLGHQWRDRVWGAFLWGFVGAIVGQIHMIGFFWQPALLGWTLWTERLSGRDSAPARTRWGSFAIGTGLGGLPLLPWVQYLLAHGLNGGGKRHFAPEFYLQWLTTGWGLNLEHQMGKVFWREFLAEPRIGGLATYGMAIAHLLLALAGLATLIAWVTSKAYRQQVRSVPGYAPMRFYLMAGAIGMGLWLTGMGQRVPVYYLTMLFPLPYLWVAVICKANPRWLGAIIVLQLAISMTFLGFIHQQGGIADGTYGPAYRLQNYPVLLDRR